MEKEKGIDVSNEIEIKNGKANPFGWSQEEIHHNGKRIGWIESGCIDLTDENYFYEMVQNGNETRVSIYLKDKTPI